MNADPSLSKALLQIGILPQRRRRRWMDVAAPVQMLTDDAIAGEKMKIARVRRPKSNCVF